MTDYAIEVQDLVVRYKPDNQVLSGIDLQIPTRDVVALVGANGSGKSTLMRALIRLQEPTSGTIRIDGRDVTGASKKKLRKIRAEVGFVFQRFNLAPRVSAFGNVVMGSAAELGVRSVVAQLAPADTRDRAMAALARVGLADKAKQQAGTLSGGQQQRVAIARMLMQRPRIVLADEPIASLDPTAGRAVLELLREIAAEQKLTILAAMHHIDLAIEYTDRMVGLQHGRVEFDRPTGDLCPADLAHLYTGNQDAA